MAEVHATHTSQRSYLLVFARCSFSEPWALEANEITLIYLLQSALVKIRIRVRSIQYALVLVVSFFSLYRPICLY